MERNGNAHTSVRHSLKLDTVNKRMRVKHHYANENKKKFKSGSVTSVPKKYSKLLSEDDTMTSALIFGHEASREKPADEESKEDEVEEISSTSSPDDDASDDDDEEEENVMYLKIVKGCVKR